MSDKDYKSALKQLVDALRGPYRGDAFVAAIQRAETMLKPDSTENCFFCRTPIGQLASVQGFEDRVAHKICFDKAPYDNKCTFKVDTVG